MGEVLLVLQFSLLMLWLNPYSFFGLAHFNNHHLKEGLGNVVGVGNSLHV